MHDELLDLVNDKDEVIGTISREEFYKRWDEKLGNLRAVEVCLRNSTGQLWIPTRTAHKRIAPNALDYSAAGHVSAGEDYLTSGLREVEEELNLKPSGEDFEYIATFAPDELPYFRKLYVYNYDREPDFNLDDFIHGEWLFPEEIINKIDNGTPAKVGMRKTIQGYIDSLTA
jgi:isopentenyldiphosphate isomerase